MWERRYLGGKWAVGGDSTGLNCWELVQAVYRNQFGIELPAMQVDGNSVLAAMREFIRNPEYANWVTVQDAPDEFHVLLMGKGIRSAHVGVWSKHYGGSILHSVQGAGVILTPSARLHELGYKIQSCWRRNG